MSLTQCPLTEVISHSGVPSWAMLSYVSISPPIRRKGKYDAHHLQRGIAHLPEETGVGGVLESNTQITYVVLLGEKQAEFEEFTKKDRKVEGKLGDDSLSSSKENSIWISKDYERPWVGGGELMKTSKCFAKRPFCGLLARVKWHIKWLWLSVLCKCICCLIGLEIRIHVADTYSLEEDVRFEHFMEWSDFMLCISIWKGQAVLAKKSQLQQKKGMG